MKRIWLWTMTREGIIEEIAKNKTVETMVDNMAVPDLYRDDLIQEIYKYLLQCIREKMV